MTLPVLPVLITLMFSVGPVSWTLPPWPKPESRRPFFPYLASSSPEHFESGETWKPGHRDTPPTISFPFLRVEIEFATS